MQPGGLQGYGPFNYDEFAEPPFGPGLPVSTGQAPQPGPGLAINNGAMPGMAVGVAPPTMLAPSEQLAQQVAETPVPAGPQGMNFARGAGLAVLGLGDAAASLAALRRGEAPRGGSNFLAGLQMHQQGQAAAAQAVQADRQWRMEMMTKIGHMKGQETGAVKDALGVVAEVAKNPNATPEDHRAAVERAVGMMAKFGWDPASSERIAGSLVRAPELATMLGKYLPLYDQTKEGDRAEIQKILNGGIAAASAGPKALQDYAQVVQGQAIATKVAPTALLSARLASQELRGLPEYAGKPIPFATLTAHLRAKYGDQAGPYEEYLSGLIGDHKAEVTGILASLGFQTPTTAQTAQAAGATTEEQKRAEARVATDPAVVGAKVRAENQEREGTRIAKAADEAAQVTARAVAEGSPPVLEAKARVKQQEMRLEQQKKEGEARFAQTNPADDAQVSGLRKEFSNASQRFVEVKQGFQQIKAGAESRTPQGGSVVREGEYATAQNAAGIPERVRTMWNRLIDGDKLSPDQRENMVKQAEKLFTQHAGNQRELVSEFTRLAKANRIQPERVIVDYFGREGGPPGAKGFHK
jgi:hypothetical protein